MYYLIFFTGTFAVSRAYFSLFFTGIKLSFTGMIWQKFSRANLFFHGHFLIVFQIFSRALFFFTGTISSFFTGRKCFFTGKKNTGKKITIFGNHYSQKSLTALYSTSDLLLHYHIRSHADLTTHSHHCLSLCKTGLF